MELSDTTIDQKSLNQAAESQGRQKTKLYFLGASILASEDGQLPFHNRAGLAGPYFISVYYG